jgi:arylsulfatase A-like enzyme/predicted neuraminidase
MRIPLPTLAALLLPALVPCAAGAADRPNIVFILADDLGYGDVKCLNPQGKIATPHLDRVAAKGMAFTDAHSSSAVCTPTRYGILTGRYDWRSALKRGVLGGYSPPLIEPGRLTVPALLKKHGYHTACVGKWHLGMDWPLKGGGTAKDYPDAWKVDYTKPVANGPTSVGFDTFFGISASLDMPPYVFIEDDRCKGEPTVEKTWIRKGPAHKDFEAIDVLPALTKRAVAYVAERGPKAKKGEPFFLYLALTAPHTPILPTKEWQGKSGLNAYGDFVMQVDAAVGEVLDALDRAGLAENTLLMVASDNGCSPAANFPQLAEKGHNPSYHFRGHKADIFDGGHRIPLLVRWPGQVKPGTTCDQTVCLNDLMATCADVLGAKLPDDAGEDSVSLVPALLGRAKGPLHEAVVHHSMDGFFAVRQGRWKLELCPGSGGWSPPAPGSPQEKGLPPVQLYDLEGDEGEKTNVQDRHPEVVVRLTRLLEKYVADGRSTPGTPQKNTGAVDVWNGKKPAPGAGPGVVRAEFLYEKAPFPQCHASTIVETKAGLVAAWFGGTREKHEDVGIWVARQDGETWTAPAQVADGKQPGGKRLPCWNPVLFRPKDGPLMLFYKVGPSPSAWWGMLRTSDDNGKTWSDARRLPDGILGPIKNKPVQLANGDILCPTSTENDGWRVHFERSADGGKTWEATPPLNDGKTIGAIQPSILFHKGGKLQAVGRTKQGKVFEVWSDDGGKTWGKMALTALPNPNSGIDAVTLADGRQLLVYNHTAEGRTPLNVAVSEDGKSWKAAAVLEGEPGEYSYPAVIQAADGLVHVTYTWKRQRIKHVVLDPKQLVLRPIKDGNWPKD